MTPGARVQAAIEIIDAIRAGQAAEQALTRWARRSRFAGSKDRAAVRDHVFDVLRCWLSAAALGGGEDGRSRMIGLCRQQNLDLDALFSGTGHAPQPLSAAEQNAGRSPDAAEMRDLPGWLWEAMCASMSEAEAEKEAALLRERAPVDLRVNLLKASLDQALGALVRDGIDVEPHGLSKTCLRVTAGARGVARSAAFLDGLVEFQDVASQAVVDALPLGPGMRVLDYCAGGGGKALAMAARTKGAVEAHDVDPARMADIPSRAQRAGADIRRIRAPRGQYDLILCDAPCSGSGSWRRSPDAKWRLNEDDFRAFEPLQRGILNTAVASLKPGGLLAYATCSLFRHENEDVAEGFLRDRPNMERLSSRALRLAEGGDGFGLTVFSREGVVVASA